MQGKQQGAGRAGRVWIRLVVTLGLLVSLLGTSVATPPPASAAGGNLFGPILGKFYGSFAPQLGANGSVVAFASWLRNFDASAPLFSLGVYYRDRANGTTGTATVPMSGTSPNGTSWPLGISPDPSGSRILYRSAASNLVPGDTLGHEDVFLFNRLAGTTERVSVASNGAEANGPSLFGAMSGNPTTGDPRYVVFGSYASNLVPGDTNGVADVFIRDRVAGTTERVSVGTGGVQANGDSLDATVSDDGRYVAFASSASNLVPGDTNNTVDIFVRDRVAGTTERVSVGYLGQGSGSSTVPRISADGRFVAFDSDADDLVPLDENFSTDVFVRDRLLGYTERVSVATSGLEGFGDSASPSISRDGRYIAFESDAEEFNPDDGNISFDIYVRDRLGRVTQRASERATGLEAFADSWSASISPEGRYVAFYSDTDEFCNGCDSNEDDDVYIKDMGSSWLNQPVGGRFTGITPKALLDTSTGPVPQSWSVGRQFASGDTLDLRVTGGSTTVPASATAVVLNLTSSGATTDGAQLSVFPTGENRKPSAALHTQVGTAVSNQVIVKVGSGGQVRFWTNKGATHLRAEVVGYFAPDEGDGYTPVTAPTLIDTRATNRPAGWPAQQRLAAGGSFSQFDVKVAGNETEDDTEYDVVPAEARAVALQITSVDASTNGSRITVRPTGSPNPGTANVLTQSTAWVTNLALVPVGSDGRVTVSIDSGASHVLVAVVGWFGPHGHDIFFPVNPIRVLDSSSTNASLSIPGRSGPLQPASLAWATLAGRGGVPSDARSIALSTSSVNATSSVGVLISFPEDAPLLLVSSLTYRTTGTATNTMLQRVDPGGGAYLFNFGLGSFHVLGDAYGFYR